MIDHVRSRLARYKAPKEVIIAQTLPRTASGKLQKNVLREPPARGDPGLGPPSHQTGAAGSS